ncbi:immunity 53 family protein [Paenisporosarcina indica]|uniref:immunity 53 family protein n=1 Tax=Paenisporosarcina indica TaxID=650093 RepID=UPI00094FDB18|nr:immunity 53 family protein [Paenisporosarcina indica]
MDSLIWLQKWYLKECNGDWEHSFGIRIETLDNPGWSVRINLIDTDLEDEIFNKVTIERHENDWIFCEINEESEFLGYGGPGNLSEILDVFKAWVNS